MACASFKGHIDYVEFTGENVRVIQEFFGRKHFLFSTDNILGLVITNAKMPDCRGYANKGDIIFQWSEEKDKIYSLSREVFEHYFKI